MPSHLPECLPFIISLLSLPNNLTRRRCGCHFQMRKLRLSRSGSFPSITLSQEVTAPVFSPRLSGCRALDLSHQPPWPPPGTVTRSSPARSPQAQIPDFKQPVGRDGLHVTHSSASFEGPEGPHSAYRSESSVFVQTSM